MRAYLIGIEGSSPDASVHCMSTKLNAKASGSVSPFPIAVKVSCKNKVTEYVTNHHRGKVDRSETSFDELGILVVHL